MTLTKEWLQKTITELEEERDVIPGAVNEDAAMALAAMKLALASLETDGVAECQHDWIFGGLNKLQSQKQCVKCGRVELVAPPAPVVPDAIEMDDDFDSAFEHGKAVGWNAYRDAMLKHSEPFIVTSDHRMMEMPQVEAINAVTAILQGADGTLTNEGTIPVTQFKPVADLYGLTSPTGGETSFTFDAVEARDFIDGGWLCQEYVTLERYQEAITNHTEDKLAMVDHSGDSNNMVEPVTTAYKLRDAVETIRSSGIAIDADKIFAERDVLNSPVIPDGWVMVPEEPTHEMLEAGDEQFGTYDVYRRMLASAPQQEVK